MELSKRKNIRLKEYDYSLNGAYFVTICTEGRKQLLWRVGEPEESAASGGLSELKVL